MKGRKPKPTQLKALHGSDQPVNPLEPIAVGDLTDEITEPPDHFTPEQRDIWALALEHSPPGMLKRIDAAALEIWCTALSIHRRASRQLARGLVIVAPNTKVAMQTPYLAIVNRQALIMLRAAEQLGFTPVSRPRISVGGVIPADPGEDMTGRSHGRETETLDQYIARAPKPSAIH